MLEPQPVTHDPGYGGTIFCLLTEVGMHSAAAPQPVRGIE
jgi:hypothetical protein